MSICVAGGSTPARPRRPRGAMERARRSARIKWPSDVMVGDRKVGGLLTEVVGGEWRATIVGIGLNVNVDLAAGQLPPTATSLAHECGHQVSRAHLLADILSRVDAHLL